MPPRSCLALVGALLCASLVSAVSLDRMSTASEMEEDQVNIPMQITRPQIRGDLSGSAQLGGQNIAAQLGSSQFDASTMSLDSAMQLPPNPNGPPLTLEATPLEGDDGSSSGSFSGSSSGSFSGSSSGSFSGSSGSSFDSLSGSGSSLDGSSGSSFGSSSGSSSQFSGSSESSGPTPVRCNPAAGPCGGGGPLREAKIVGSLTGGGKRYSTVLPSDKDIWYFDDGSARAPPQKPDAPEVLAIQNSDPELAQLKENLERLVDKMDQEKGWIEDVRSIINHYKQKAGAVAAGLKNESNAVKALQQQIAARKKMAARKALENKLLKVNAQLQQLKSATSSVSGEAKSLTALKANLSKSIQSIQSEVEHLRRA